MMTSCTCLFHRFPHSFDFLKPTGFRQRVRFGAGNNWCTVHQLLFPSAV